MYVNEEKIRAVKALLDEAFAESRESRFSNESERMDKVISNLNSAENMMMEEKEYFPSSIYKSWKILDGIVSRYLEI